MKHLPAGWVSLALLAAAALSACGGGSDAPTASAAASSALSGLPGGPADGGGDATTHGDEVSLLAQGQVTPGAGLDAQRHAALVALAKRNVKDREDDGRSPAATQVTLSYTSPQVWARRLHTSSIAQLVPDADGLFRFHERRERSVAGALANWGSGQDPNRQSDYHWTGSEWMQCAVQQEHVRTAWTPEGTTTYDFCVRRDFGSTKRTSYDIGGLTMREVYQTMLDSNTGNVTIAAPDTALGNAVYPREARLHYYEASAQTSAVSYYPGLGNAVRNTRPDVASGAQQACNTITAGTLANTYTSYATTLESMVAGNRGTPCLFLPAQFPSPTGPRNEWWSQSTVSLGILGTAPLNPASTTYFTGNQVLRVAFGAGNAVTYYSCQQRYNDGSIRNCDPIGTGQFAIATLGDARIMTFSNTPPLVDQLTYARVFVERGGKVYQGFVNRQVLPSLRLNLPALNALAAQLGLPLVDPEVPHPLTRASYQGDWQIGPAGEADGNDTLTLRISPAGTAGACIQNLTNGGIPCSLLLDAATGAFTLSLGGTSLSGTLRMVEGTGSGVVMSSGIQSGTFQALRR